MSLSDTLSVFLDAGLTANAITLNKRSDDGKTTTYIKDGDSFGNKSIAASVTHYFGGPSAKADTHVLKLDVVQNETDSNSAIVGKPEASVTCTFRVPRSGAGNTLSPTVVDLVSLLASLLVVKDAGSTGLGAKSSSFITSVMQGYN